MILVVNSSSYFHCCGNTIAKFDFEKVLYVFGRDSFSTVSQIFVLGQLLGQLKCIDQPMKSVHAIWRSWIRLNSLGSNTIYIIQTFIVGKAILKTEKNGDDITCESKLHKNLSASESFVLTSMLKHTKHPNLLLAETLFNSKNKRTAENAEFLQNRERKKKFFFQRKAYTYDNPQPTASGCITSVDVGDFF